MMKRKSTAKLSHPAAAAAEQHETHWQQEKIIKHRWDLLAGQTVTRERLSRHERRKSDIRTALAVCLASGLLIALAYWVGAFMSA